MILGPILLYLAK